MLLSEGFNYPDGSLITVSGAAWSHHSGSVDGQVQVASGRVQLTQADSEDVNTPLAGQPYASDTALTIYLGATVRFTALPGSGNQYFLHLKNGTSSGFRGKVFASTGGAAPGTFRLGISEGSSSTADYLNRDLALSTDYRLVLRYTVDSAETTLWVDPALESDPSVAATDDGTALDLVALALRQSTGIGNLELDDVMVATTFAEVLLSTEPQAPVILAQPQSRNVTVGASTSFSVTAAGEAPLGYQWRFNGATVPGATNTVLQLTEVTAQDAGLYSVTVSNAVGTTHSLPATLSVVSAVDTFSVLNYNVKGNGTEDWSTNSPQVRAIGRQMEYLDPDIITLQEIPLTNTWQMTNFVTAFRPGFHLASNSGSDGYIRSVILSRYPINRSQSWLDGVSLVPFGYNGTFTRDLFEAEIVVPGFPEPVHVFTVHLKAGQGTTDSARRAAEANAISNFFVAGFLTAHASRPYLLTGDMNEDVNNPPASTPQTLERLTSLPTGLQLATPVNPFSGSERTISIQSSLFARYDYILPGTFLFTNVIDSEVFRTDLLPGPNPPLLAGDSVTASDHLPVRMVFKNPFDLPFRLLSAALADGSVSLTWESSPGRVYDIEGTEDLFEWTVVATNLTAPGTQMSRALDASNAVQFYRVLQREP